MNPRSVLSDRPERADPEGQKAITAALASVDDPEYPGVSIVELGLVEDVRVDGGRVEVDLVPTFSGCPALAFIAADVRAVLGALADVDEVVVTFVATPVWGPERITPVARRQLAGEFGVGVRLGSAPAPCPHCGAPAALAETSAFGPVRCRSVNRCGRCGEVVELIR